jgi:hypothetical protein
MYSHDSATHAGVRINPLRKNGDYSAYFHYAFTSYGSAFKEKT